MFSAANVRWDLPVSLFSPNILWIVVQSIPNVAKGGEIAIHRHACKSPDWENSMYAIKKMHLGTVEVLWYLYLDGWLITKLNIHIIYDMYKYIPAQWYFKMPCFRSSYCCILIHHHPPKKEEEKTPRHQDFKISMGVFAVEFLWGVLFEMSLSKTPDRSN